MTNSTHYPLLLHGDALELLPTLMAGTVDVVVTDPPAGIGFMGKPWDSFAGYEPRGRAGEVRHQTLALLGLKPWEAGFVAFLADLWTEVDRVLKPGGFVCSWALPKTADLAGLAMRLTGWTIHESVLHLFGSGMNKSGCTGKQIDKAAGAEREVVGESPDSYDRGACGYKADVIEGRRFVTAPATDDAKRWTGWHSQIAPGHEQWLIGQKPGRHTYARQLVERGCGAFNVGACKVPRGDGVPQFENTGADSVACYGDGLHGSARTGATSSGSHPRNVVLTAGGPGCPVKGLDRQSGVSPAKPERRGPMGGSREGVAMGRGGDMEGTWPADQGGGASRYFTRFDQRVGYFPKASDRSVPGRPDLRNEHPTHKHPDLMRWLVRLMAATAEHTGGPPAVVLDPCMGSGTTGWACAAEGVSFIGIERDDAHFEVARGRILGAGGDPELAAEANEQAPAGAQLGLL